MTCRLLGDYLYFGGRCCLDRQVLITTQCHNSEDHSLNIRLNHVL
jgi:hypothetical protein